MKYKLLLAVFVAVAIIGTSVYFFMDNLEKTDFNDSVAIKNPAKSNMNNIDVIVTGSDPEGIAAAVSAARNGLKTLLIDTRPEVGGLMTRGWLNSLDMNYDPNGKVLNEGIFLEWYKQIEGDSFRIETAQKAFENLVNKEFNLSVLLNVERMEPIMDERNSNKVKGTRVVKDGKETVYEADHFIDATQNADVAYASGIEFTVGQEDYLGSSRYMASTVVFEVKKVDWGVIKRHLNEDDDPHSGANDQSAWGYKEMYNYKPKDQDIGMRGLNIGRQTEDSILINALYVFNVDPFDPSSIKTGQEKARNELEHIVAYMREHLVGFENAELGQIAPELYIRETRHMKGLYRLNINDVLGNRDFEDRIGFGSYPVDIQSLSQTERGYVVGVPDQYAVPYRSIVPESVENMLVVGRSASFDSLAHGSARVIPVGMATGQAAGVAAAIARTEDVTFQQIAEDKALVKSMQATLVKQGMKLDSFDYAEEVSKHWAYEGIKYLRSFAIVYGGYDNNYNLEKPLKETEFYSMLYRYTHAIDNDSDFPQPGVLSEEPIMKEQMARHLVDAFEISVDQSKSHYGQLSGLLSEETLARIEASDEVNRGIMSMVVYELAKEK